MKALKIPFIFALATLFLTSCDKDVNCVEGEGTITTEILPIANFEGIELTNSTNVTFKYGPTQEVKAIGHPNIIAKLETDVSNSLWKIDLEDGCYNDFNLELEITHPNVKILEITGSGNILFNDFENQSQLSVKIEGSGDVTLNKFDGMTNLDINISGSGNFDGFEEVSTLETLNLNISGSGDYTGFPLNCDICTIHTTGSGDTKTTANTLLNVTISGSGNVSYKGSPTINQNITGSGDLINAN